MRPNIARANEQLGPRQQLANTPLPQSTTPGLHPVSIHQMTPTQRTSDCSLLLIYRLRKDERLNWPSWLTCSGPFTHLTGHSSDADRAQDMDSSSAKDDRRSVTVPRQQLTWCRRLAAKGSMFFRLSVGACVLNLTLPVVSVSDLPLAIS